MNVRFLREPGHNYSPTNSAGLDRSLFPSLGLTVEVLSGQHIPRPANVEDDWEIVDPYVTVREGSWINKESTEMY